MIHRAKPRNNALDAVCGIVTIKMPLPRHPQTESFCPMPHSLPLTLCELIIMGLLHKWQNIRVFLKAVPLLLAIFFLNTICKIDFQGLLHKKRLNNCFHSLPPTLCELGIMGLLHKWQPPILKCAVLLFAKLQAKAVQVNKYQTVITFACLR